MFGLGSNEVLIIGLVLLVLFGGAKLPALGRGLGNFITEFKEGIKGAKKEIESEEKDEKKNDDTEA